MCWLAFVPLREGPGKPPHSRTIARTLTSSNLPANFSTVSAVVPRDGSYIPSNRGSQEPRGLRRVVAGKMGSPAISVQVGHDLEEFPGKPRTPSQLFAMGLRGCVKTPSAPRSEHPEARVFAVRHHPHRRELPIRGPVPPVWSGFPPKA